MSLRTIEDRLREEYASLLPHARHAVEELEVEVRYLLIPVLIDLAGYERIIIKSRVKECESALESLRRRQEGKRFEPATSDAYSLRNLRDLAAVRVLAFPERRVLQIDGLLRSRFVTWRADPVPGAAPGAESIALKYYGYCDHSPHVCAELQIVAMLIGLFWEVEHGALYTPAPEIRDAQFTEEMRERDTEVIRALRNFERQFDQMTQSNNPHTV
jgi:hypothetical protein